MEDIRVYNFEFQLLHIENDVITSNWTIYYNGIGTWEGHFALDSDIVPILMENDYLVVIQGQKQAIVTGKLADGDFAVYGRTVNWILSRRTMPKFNVSALAIDKDPESIARYVAQTSLADVPNFTLGAAIGLPPLADFWRNSTNPADKVVRECLDLMGAGHRVTFDVASRQWVFQVFQGKDNDLIISTGNNNAQNLRYAEDAQNEFSGGWYEQTYGEAKEWDAAANTPALVDFDPANYTKKYRVTNGGTQFGISFSAGNFLLCNTKDGAWKLSKNDAPSFPVYLAGERTGIYKWDGVLGGSVESEAISSFATKKRSKKTTAASIDLICGRDYELGDRVRLQLEFGTFRKTVTRRITGVSFWYENNNIGEKPIFKEDNDE